MKHIFVRPAEAKDVENVVEWSKLNPEWDPEVGRYKTTYTLCAFDETGPIMYMPIQRPQMMDAAAIRPGASTLQIANAFRELTQAAVTQMFLQGSGEVYFLGTDEGTNALAESQLFLRLPWSIYRLKAKDLEHSSTGVVPDTN